MIFTPSGNKILALRHEKKETTDGGIIMPDLPPAASDSNLFDKSTDYATVVSVGEGIRNKKNNKLKPVQIKKGDVIIFNNNKCLDLVLDGKKYVMMRESEVLATIPRVADIINDFFSKARELNDRTKRDPK